MSLHVLPCNNNAPLPYTAWQIPPATAEGRMGQLCRTVVVGKIPETAAVNAVPERQNAKNSRTPRRTARGRYENRFVAAGGSTRRYSSGTRRSSARLYRNGAGNVIAEPETQASQTCRQRRQAMSQRSNARQRVERPRPMYGASVHVSRRIHMNQAEIAQNTEEGRTAKNQRHRR